MNDRTQSDVQQCDNGHLIETNRGRGYTVCPVIVRGSLCAAAVRHVRFERLS